MFIHAFVYNFNDILCVIKQISERTVWQNYSLNSNLTKSDVNDHVSSDYMALFTPNSL